MNLIKQIKRYFHCLSFAFSNYLDDFVKRASLPRFIASAEEGELYLAMKGNERYNDDDFIELLRGASGMSGICPYSYDDIVGAMALLEHERGFKNDKLLINTKLAIEKAQLNAMSLMCAAERMLLGEM